jgi:flotillin
MDIILLFVLGAAALTVFLIITYSLSRYKRCASDQILVIYGKVEKGKSSRTMHGGGTVVWPVIQDFAFLSLTPMTINIPLENALSLQNIRIHVPSTFTVGVTTDQDIVKNAAERLLHLAPNQIEEMAQEIIFGQLRLTVASLTIEQINQDRESFLESIRHNVEPELNKIGLHLINVNVTDITDESDYIESIGLKAASEARQRAKVDVADQRKMGAIGEADANREKDIRVAENVAEAEKGKKKAEAERRVFVQDQESSAIDGENTANAEIAKSNASLVVEQAVAAQRAEVAQAEAKANIQKAEYLAEKERLNAEEVVRVEIEKRKIEIAAEAEAEKIRREAKGEADGVLLKYEAQAKGVQQLLAAKAKGYSDLISSVDGDSQAAATLLMIEKLEEMVKHQVEAISNLKIDKITVWDSGSGTAQGSTTANFLSDFIKSIPPLQDLSSMVGLELPEFLGKMIDENKQKTLGDGVIDATEGFE